MALSFQNRMPMAFSCAIALNTRPSRKKNRLRPSSSVVNLRKGDSADMHQIPNVASTADSSHPSPVPDGSGAFPLRRFFLVLVYLMALAFPCAVLYNLAGPTWPIAGFQLSQGQHAATLAEADALDVLDTEDEDVRLERVLKKAAMVDKTVILTTLNAAWSGPGSTLDLFLESFRIGDRTSRLLSHLVVVALDEKAYGRCKSVHPHCFALATAGVDFSGQKNFMSDGYLEMMWRRIDFLRVVLEKGYDFIFTDTDILWFRDPLPRFYPDGEFQIACDHFTGNSYDLQNRPNGGFNYVRSNNRTIEFYKFWYTSRLEHPGLHDQDVLNLIKNDPRLKKIGLQMRFLDTALFGGLCEPSRDLNMVCTMHANCCIGLRRKLHDLRVMLEDWRRFMSLPPSVRGSRLATWSVPQNCSLAPLKS